MSVICILCLCGCDKQEKIIYFTSESTQTTYVEEQPENKDEAQTVSQIKVYVCGAVEEPGVIALSEDCRVVDAIALAGGMTAEADADYINLASRLTDGEKVYVPTLAETAEWEETQGRDVLVNINTADLDELCTLPGIGESKAADIIAYREKNGAFKEKEDIMNVPGIKESAYAKISEKIKVE